MVKKTWTFIVDCAKFTKWWLLGQAVLSCVFSLNFLVVPYFTKLIVDSANHIDRKDAYDVLIFPVAMCISASIAVVILYRLYDYFWLKTNPPLKKYIGDKLCAHMMRHSHQLYQNHMAGDLGNKIKDVMSGVPDLFKICIDKFMGNILMVAFFSMAMFRINARFAVALILWAIFFVLASVAFSKKASLLSNKSAEARSIAIGSIVDVFGNMMSIRLFSRRKYESSRLESVFYKYVIADQARDWFFIKMFACLGLSFSAYYGISLVWLVYGFRDGTITAGDFAFIVMSNSSIIECLWFLSKDIGTFADTWGNITHGLRIALSPIEIVDHGVAATLVVGNGEIVFDAVQFHYKGVAPLFHNESVTISPGQKVGLVGYSGSGKTTFVNLILRLYDVSAGRILIDGQDIRYVSQDSLRSSIAIIPQDPIMFHRSIIENIRYGNVSASDDDVFSAARKAHAHEFISRNPDGYGALVGERGVKLSGGQRQRIAIARAILKNAPILILDEATSQLDSITEAYIQESLWELMQGKTTIVVAHRLSTLLHMDRILVFDRGKVVEDGKHHDLIQQEGLYKTLWDTQIGGFLASSGEETDGDSVS
ncbi:ABC transporter ATP-binding protein [Candidatus Hydrogenosomobacter endosymbioticus]|uniref:ABC transporter ATP-binding protein n=1 Tax=Candidatus Hydrogenosomobacter endosymbioticus TaxID=2558174 RepID=A0ABN6L3J9_9PROT|nr:ABC transporter ATP-binding protein [Candidatus Hydrogenosomobacter endosymbioticus]BDB96443.1 ABC transporter ATP-binding protein [Candidatus Hydrogenosomobacter endosymbioticus]